MSKKKTSSTDCRSYEDLISEWVFESSVDEKTLAPVKGHMKNCAPCKELKKHYEFIAKHLTLEDINSLAPGNLKQQVIRQISDKNIRKTSMVKWFSVAASLALIAGISYQQSKQPSQEDSLNTISEYKITAPPVKDATKLKGLSAPEKVDSDQVVGSSYGQTSKQLSAKTQADIKPATEKKKSGRFF